MRCELRLGSVVLPAMLLDESSGGFGVLVGGLPSISANQRAQLRNDRGWFDCRIIYAREVVPTKAVPVMEVVPTKAVPVMEVVPTKAVRNSAGLEKELFERDGTIIKKELFKGDITIITTDCNGCEEPVEDDGATKHITADGAMEYITTADIKEFTAGMEGPWFQLGIRCLGRIAPPSEPATSLPVESGGVNPMQWIKSMLACVFDR